MSLPLYQVDAFTEQPFSGNPAAVCLLDAERDDAWLQAVAAEMNLSETAYVRRRNDDFDLRWFTPKLEVALCGHATLASAHVLWERSDVPPAEPIRFHSQSGPLIARRVDDLIELDFPANACRECRPPDGMLESLGVKATFVGRDRMDYLVEVADETIVRGVRPDFRTLAQLETRGVMVTSRSASDDFDFVSRYFAPAAGIDEDPVTGSAHCCLGDYWRRRLGKDTLLAYQASARGGVVRVRVTDERVYLGGQALTVFTGELRC